MGRWTTRRIMAGTAVVALLLALLPTFPAPLEAIVRLAIGWLIVRGEVAPRLVVRPAALADAAGALVLLAVVAHAVGRRWDWWTAGMTIRLVGGATALVLAGLAVAGCLGQVGHLLFSGEPLTGRGRPPALRSASNLRMIGLGLSQYANMSGQFPPGATFDAHGTPLHGWPTFILPYVDNVDLHQATDFARPWDDPTPRNGVSNRTITGTGIGIYKLPGAEAVGPFLGYATNAWVIGGDQPRPLASLTDGLGTTILAGEAAGEYKPWGSPVHWRDPALGINRSPSGFGSPFPGGGNFLFADGSVRFLRDKLPMPVFRALATPDGGERVDPARLDD